MLLWFTMGTQRSNNVIWRQNYVAIRQTVNGIHIDGLQMPNFLNIFYQLVSIEVLLWSGRSPCGHSHRKPEAGIGLGGFHDNVIKRKHFPRYWTFARGIQRSPWNPRTKASDAEVLCFLWCEPKQTVPQTVDKLVIWDAVVSIVTSL